MIRNFIYLDEEKMYSLSSQLFSGVKEYILSELITEKDNNEDQKGPLGSGRLTTRGLKETSSRKEMISLNDFAYTEFEEKLIADEMVFDPDASSKKDFLEKSFVKVKGKVVFNDISFLKKTLLNLDNIFDSLVYLEANDSIGKVKAEIAALEATTGNAGKGKKERIIALKNAIDLKLLRREKEYDVDPDLMVHVAELLEFGYQEDFEVQVYNKEKQYSSVLNRQCIRENENSLVKKYSRKTEVDFVLFGLMTQKKTIRDVEHPSVAYQKKNSNEMNEALMDMVDGIGEVEQEFFGSSENQIVVDPIAIYTEI